MTKGTREERRQERQLRLQRGRRRYEHRASEELKDWKNAEHVDFSGMDEVQYERRSGDQGDTRDTESDSSDESVRDETE